jgi:hypothetical protein
VIDIIRSVAISDVRKILAQPRDIERGAFEFYPPDMLEKLLIGRKSRASTVLEDGQPIAAGGVTLTDDPRVCAAWFIARKDPRPYARAVWRETKAIIGGALVRGLIIVADVVPGQEVAERFVRKLGFQRVPGSEHQPTLQFYLVGKQS